MSLGDVFGNASEKSGNIVSKAFSGVTGIYKDAIAANKADDIYEANVIADDAKNGKLHNTGVLHDVGDGIEDAINIVTVGVSRKVTNMFTHEVDYKALKSEKKAAKKNGVDLSVKDRTAILSNYVDSDKYNTLSGRNGVDIEQDDSSDDEYEA